MRNQVIKHSVVRLEFCFFFRTCEPGDENTVYQEVQSPSEGSVF